jgi:glycosyltransferase involved in cell wall biosynthesis
MDIVFFCPSPTVINGGIKHIFRMAETLAGLGYQACVFEQSAQRPNWFHSSAPVVGEEIFHNIAGHVFVLPEDQPKILEDFKHFPNKKVIYSQNHFYGALGIGDAESYADYGVTDILCSSRTIYDHAQLRHPKLKAYVIPCAVDRQIFKPAATKENIIAYMPRKRSIEATYLYDMFRFTYPHNKAWTWQELSGLGEGDVAQALGKAKVFLSLSRLEGFGLTPLEAMASGCVVAGFTGIGGREYATSENGFWVNEDDFSACVEALGKAVAMAVNGAENMTNAVSQTLAAYTPQTFKQAVKECWTQILQA